MPWATAVKCVVLMTSARSGTHDETDAGAEVPGTLANAEEAKGSEVTCPQTALGFLAFLEDFEKRQACGVTRLGRTTPVVGKTVKPMLPTAAAAAGPQSQFHVLSKRMCKQSSKARASGGSASVVMQGDPVLGPGEVMNLAKHPPSMAHDGGD